MMTFPSLNLISTTTHKFLKTTALTKERDVQFTLCYEILNTCCSSLSSTVVKPMVLAVKNEIVSSEDFNTQFAMIKFTVAPIN